MTTILSCNSRISKTTNPFAQTRTRSSSTAKSLRVSHPTVVTMAESGNLQRSKGMGTLIEFPHASVSVRNLMLELVSKVEDQFESQLLPCTLPDDVQFYQSESGSSEASLQIRCGSPSSKIDLMLGSWLNFSPPTGEKLDISCLYVYLNSMTDAPNFIIEVVESSPTSIAVILDLPPRKDLVVHPKYLKEFYEDTKLDVQRQILFKLPEVTPYLSPSLHIRSVMSPTAIFANIQVGESGAERMDEIVSEHISSVANEVLRLWLETCALVERNVGDEEKLMLEKRDSIVKNKAIEVDLRPNLPRLFGQATADRVIAAISKAFNGKDQS